MTVSICNTIHYSFLRLMLTFHALVLPVILCDTTLLLLYNCVSPLVVIEGRGRFSASHRRFRCRDFLYANRAALNIDTYILLSGGPAALNNDTNRPHFLFCTIFRPPLAKNISENFENS